MAQLRWNRLCTGILLSLALAACSGDKDPLDMLSTTASTSTTTGGASTSSGDPSGGPEPTGGGSSGGGPNLPTREVCDRYLECLAVTSPQSLPDAQAGFGPDGTCWDGPPESQQQCITACQTALEDLYTIYYPDEPACALCEVAEDCGPNMMCEDGACAEVVGPGCGDGIVQPDETCDLPYCVDDCQSAPCNPFTHAGCAQGEECRFAWFDLQLGVDCLPKDDTLPTDGASCTYTDSSIDYCAAGLVCAPEWLINGCPDTGCCTRLCNVQEPDNCPNGRVCQMMPEFYYYESYVGVCVLL